MKSHRTKSKKPFTSKPKPQEICDDLFDVPISFKQIVELDLARGENEVERSLKAFFKAKTYLPDAWQPSFQAEFGLAANNKAWKKQVSRAKREHLAQILKEKKMPRSLFRDWRAWRNERLGVTAVVSRSDPEPNPTQPTEIVADTVKRLDQEWFWLRDNETLQKFESDPYAQGYEVLRRHPAHALKPNMYMPALPPGSSVFREPWTKLNEWERAYIRSMWFDELSQIGLIYKPPIVGTKAIYFRCDQPPEYLFQSAKSFIEWAIRMRQEDDSRQRIIAHPGPISWQAAREAASKKRIEEMSQGTEQTNQPKKPAAPSLNFGTEWVMVEKIVVPGDQVILVPVHRRRPRSDGRKPSTLRKFKWEAQAPDDDAAAVVLYLPPIPEPSRIDDQDTTTFTVFWKKKGFAKESSNQRPMYADEILAYFRTFLTKPPKDFAQYRRRIRRRNSRLRRTEPRSITLGLVTFDLREVAPKANFKTLVRYLFKKAGIRMAATERKLLIGLSTGFRAISKLHSRLNTPHQQIT